MSINNKILVQPQFKLYKKLYKNVLWGIFNERCTISEILRDRLSVILKHLKYSCNIHLSEFIILH